MKKLKVLFKTKGGHKEGMGDVMSSLSLAEEFRKKGHEALFVINSNKTVKKIILENNFENITAGISIAFEKLLSGRSIDIAILNQMNTPENEALIFKNQSKLLVTIDDTGDSAKLADLPFNLLYSCENSITDLKYMPVANLYRQKHGTPKIIREKVENILVTQGGSDTYGFTPKIVKSLYDIPQDINIDVVLGPNFAHFTELNRVLKESPRTFNLVKAKNDLSELMVESDIAISAGGNTLFELACLGVPVIVLCGELFEVETANRLQKEGFGINLGFGKNVDEKDISKSVLKLINNTPLRSKMSARGKKLIDGSGSQRMVETIIENFEKKNTNRKKSINA